MDRQLHAIRGSMPGIIQSHIRPIHKVVEKTGRPCARCEGSTRSCERTSGRSTPKEGREVGTVLLKKKVVSHLLCVANAGIATCNRSRCSTRKPRKDAKVSG